MKKLLLAVLVLAFVATALAGDKDDSGVKKWRKKYAKEWKTKDSASIERRSGNVKRRRERIQANNEDPDRTFEMGSNEYDDLDSEEFNVKLCGTKKESVEYVPEPTFRSNPAAPKFNAYTATTVPATLDWSSYCLPVVSQGRCGSCWAFSTLSMLECYNRMRFGTGFNTQLSPQYLVDCDKTNFNCSGGWPRKTLDYIKLNSISVPSWPNYPYTSASYFVNSTYKYTGVGACKSYISRVPVNFNNIYQQSLNGDENALKVTIANYGPVTVAMYVSASFQNYKSGVYYDGVECTKAGVANCAAVNHGVVITGYTTLNGVPVWIVKNSWGTTWGTNGYIYMARNRQNNCNIACTAMYVD